VETKRVEGGPPPAKLPTVLCIDDDQLILGVCRDALEDRGYRTLVATDGLAGIEMAMKERPDLILLDVMMPGMDGFEVCALLRSAPNLKDIPIILLTAMNLPDLDRKGAEAGATLTMRKPFSPAMVADTVARALGGNSSPRATGEEPT
jgi:putative two-component system response regulator